MDEQGPNSGLNQPPDRVYARAKRVGLKRPVGPTGPPIYRGHQPHGPTPPIHLLGFRATVTDRVLLLPSDSTADR
jgi:hypothetical protein